MKKIHIDYLREMLDSIVVEGETILKDKFLEIHPPVNKIVEMVPCCVLVDFGSNNLIDGVTVWQDITYRLAIWVRDVKSEIVSEIDTPGMLDQIARYVALNNRIEENNGILISIGKSGISTDLANEGLYLVFVDITFKDSIDV